MASTSLMSRIAFQWKRGWNEIPEVMGAACIGITSLIVTVSYLPFMDPVKLNRRYKREYFVMRSDDPRLEFVRRWEDSPLPTKL